MLLVISGSVTVEILTDDDSTSIPLTTGQFTIVPRGLWHRHVDVVDLVEMYYTPATASNPTHSTRAGRVMSTESARVLR